MPFLLLDKDLDGLADSDEDANANGTVDVGETDPLDDDTDNDGLLDSEEDINGNSIVDPGETDPLDDDTDGDGANDGTDDLPLDPTETDDTDDTDGDGTGNNADTDDDNDGLLDTAEDANGNSMVDPGETDPLLADTDGDGVDDGVDLFPLLPYDPFLSDMSVNYFEDFTGEIGVPTSPEFDALSAGSVFLYDSGNGPPGPPSFATSGIDFSVTAVDGGQGSEVQGLTANPAPISASEDVAVAMNFEAASSTVVTPYFLQQSALLIFDAGGSISTPDTVLYAALVSFDIGSGANVELNLLRLDVGTGIISVLDAAPISPSMLSQLGAGAPFSLTMRIDRERDEAMALIVAAGESLILLADASVAGELVVAANAEVLVLDTIGGVGSAGEDDSNTVTLSELAVFGDPVAVPALDGLGMLALVALMGASVGWASHRLRTP